MNHLASLEAENVALRKRVDQVSGDTQPGGDSFQRSSVTW
jgi:hypothetical protein